jgi:hypothetical protein
MAKFSWKDAPDLIEALTRCQNSKFNANRDILSFAGFCESRDELEAYLCREEIAVQNLEQDEEYGCLEAV